MNGRVRRWPGFHSRCCWSVAEPDRQGSGQHLTPVPVLVAVAPIFPYILLQCRSVEAAERHSSRAASGTIRDRISEPTMSAPNPRRQKQGWNTLDQTFRNAANVWVIH